MSEESDAPRPWVELEITEKVAKGFATEGIETPTPIQQQSIPPILAKKPVLIHAPTGTGKTLAYLLPLLERLSSSPHSGRALVITPSTELAMQIVRVAKTFKEDELSVGHAISGVRHERQRQSVQKSTRLIVGTPGRVHELYQGKKLKKVTMLVLDEPEPVLSAKGGDFLFTLLRQPEPKVQLILAGATLGPKSQALIDEFMGPAGVEVSGAPSKLQSSIRHTFVSIRGKTGKDVALARFIQNQKCKRAIVFANKDNVIRHLYRYLNEHGHTALSLSQNRSPRDRQAAVEKMRDSKVRVLIMTDAASRGLDFPHVPWVFHYDLPSSAQAYLHRAGRTGRANQEGISVAILTDQTKGLFKRYIRELGVHCKPFEKK